jgi:hypothetical protein
MKQGLKLKIPETWYNQVEGVAITLKQLVAFISNALILLKIRAMKSRFGLLAVFFIFCFSVATLKANAQCSICTRTAQQLGEGPAKGMNAGIIYLAFTPLAIAGFIGFRWWRHNQGGESGNK